MCYKSHGAILPFLSINVRVGYKIMGDIPIAKDIVASGPLRKCQSTPVLYRTYCYRKWPRSFLKLSRAGKLYYCYLKLRITPMFCEYPRYLNKQVANKMAAYPEGFRIFNAFSQLGFSSKTRDQASNTDQLKVEWNCEVIYISCGQNF